MNNKAKFTIIAILILTPMTTIYASGSRNSLIPRLMEQPGIVEAQFLFEKASFRSSHASTIVETQDNIKHDLDVYVLIHHLTFPQISMPLGVS